MNKIFFLISLIAVLSSCGNENVETSVEQAGGEAEQSDFVSLTPLQMQSAGIELGRIEQRNLKTSVKANGMLSVPNQNKAFVSSVNRGVITTLLIRPGNFVKKGQTIATIVNPDIARMQQDLQTTNSQVSLAEVEVDRLQQLVQGNAAPLKNLQRAQTELATLRATQKALQEQLNTMGISTTSVSRGDIMTTMAVRAPISGTVSSISAQIGSNVDPATPIAEIVNNSELHLDLFVYEKDLGKLKKSQTIHFTLTNNPDKDYRAEVYSIGTSFASETRTIPVHAIVKGDKEGLIEGMNITALINVGDSVLPAVPNDAIVSFQGLDYIFVLRSEPEENSGHDTGVGTESRNDSLQRSEIVFERIPVVRGVSDMGFTEIRLFNELPAETKIISRGAFFANAKLSNTGEH